MRRDKDIVLMAFVNDDMAIRSVASKRWEFITKEDYDRGQLIVEHLKDDDGACS